MSNNRSQLEQRRLRVVELHLRGWTQAAIAAELNVVQSTVNADLKVVHDQWRASAVRDLDLQRETELKKLRLIEREAWVAWEGSKAPREQSKMTQGNQGNRAERTVRQQAADPRFLKLVWDCVAARRALLGLDAPTRIAPTTPDGQDPYRLAVKDLSDEQLELMLRLQDRVSDISTGRTCSDN